MQQKQSLYKLLAGYPVLLVLAWIIGTVRRFWNSFHAEPLGDGWPQTHLITGSLSGLWNFLFLVYSKPTAWSSIQAIASERSLAESSLSSGSCGNPSEASYRDSSFRTLCMASHLSSPVWSPRVLRGSLILGQRMSSEL